MPLNVHLIRRVGHGPASRQRRLVERIFCTKTTSSSSPPLITHWPELDAWRSSPINLKRGWNVKQGTATSTLPSLGAALYPRDSLPRFSSLLQAARTILATSDPLLKCELTHVMFESWSNGHLPFIDGNDALDASTPLSRPARPSRPPLVTPRAMPTNSALNVSLNVYVLHALAHVELNAIDLALDTLVRFSTLPLDRRFASDFARIACDEARHFGWLSQRLQELDCPYGSLPAHDILWDGAEASCGDLCGRLVIVSLTQEARGLDAGPRLMSRLIGAGDVGSAAIVNRIASEERAHVAVGVFHFRALCDALDVDALSEFASWMAHVNPAARCGPFDHEARQAVGLERGWYESAVIEREGKGQGGKMKTEEARAGLAISASLPPEGVVQVPPRGGSLRDWEALRDRLATMIASESERADG